MKISDPTPEATALWLSRIGRAQLHDQGWITINQRFNGIARAMRPYIRQNFTTPEEQEAAFDGLTLALLTLAHFEDIEQLCALFDTTDEKGAYNPQTKDAKNPKITGL